MSKNKTGRNDPCPCGSGKKYKNCCIELGHETGADLFTRYNQTITDGKLKLDEAYKREIKKIRKDAQQIFLRYNVGNNLPADHESLFSDWLWFDMGDSEGNTLALDYLRSHGDFLPASLKECLIALTRSYLSIYEPLASGDGFMKVRDIFTNRENQLILKEALDVNLNDKPLLLLGRLVDLAEGNVFSGMVLIIENNHGQAEYILSHVNYLKELKNESDTLNLLKTSTDIIYGLFDHAYHKKHISINDIRALRLNEKSCTTLQEMLDASEKLAFVHDVEDVRWYQDISPDAYKRIGLGKDYVLSFISILEDLNNWNNILGNDFPGIKEWPLVNSRFLCQAPPDEFLAVWYNAVRDQETERWLHTPHNELDGKTPLEELHQEGGRQKILDLLNRFSERLEKNDEGRNLVNYMRQRIMV